MNLNSLNPFTWFQTILIWVGLLAIGMVIGGIGGCEYKQARWDASKIAQMEKAKEEEKDDRIAGKETVKGFEENKGQIQSTSKQVLAELDQKKPAIVKFKCPALPVTKSESPMELTKDEPELKVLHADRITFSSDFVRMYDLLIESQNSGVRAGVNVPVPEVEINAGVRTILQNLEICRIDQTRLETLQKRIREKQKIFGQE